MKIKPPPIPPSGTPKETGKLSNIGQRSSQVVNALAGLVGGGEAKRKEEAQKKSAELSEAEKRKRLKSFGSKCGIQANDSFQQATFKIVHSVLEEEYDPEERGFKKMIQEITDFIEQSNELRDKFKGWISAMKSQ